MSASIATTSPTARLAGKRPPSTDGATPSMMTRRRPSNRNSATPLPGASCMPLARLQELSDEWPCRDAEKTAGWPAAENEQAIDLFRRNRTGHDVRDHRPALHRGGHTDQRENENDPGDGRRLMPVVVAEPRGHARLIRGTEQRHQRLAHQQRVAHLPLLGGLADRYQRPFLPRERRDAARAIGHREVEEIHDGSGRRAD